MGRSLRCITALLIQVPGLFIYKAKWSFSLGWNDPKLREVLRLMFPRMLASGVFTINFLAFSNVASSMPEGTASAFGWVYGLWTSLKH